MNASKKLAVVRAVASRVGGMLGFDPVTAWRELPFSARQGAVAILELASSSTAMLPPSPPAELAALLERAAEESGLPVDLLIALSWELARYGAEERVPGTAGPMALPAAFIGRSLEDQVRGAAAGLQVARARRGGLAAALVAYCRDVDLARAVVGTFVLLTTSRAELPQDTHSVFAAIVGEVAV